MKTGYGRPTADLNPGTTLFSGAAIVAEATSYVSCTNSDSSLHNITEAKAETPTTPGYFDDFDLGIELMTRIHESLTPNFQFSNPKPKYKNESFGRT